MILKLFMMINSTQKITLFILLRYLSKSFLDKIQMSLS